MYIHRKATSYIGYFFLALFILLLFPSRFLFYPGPGLDESLNIGLHLAIQYKMVFGRDLFTFNGPLGILRTRLPISVNILVYLLFDVYILATLAHVLKKTLRDQFGYILIAFIFCLIPIFRIAGPEDRVFFFCLFYLLAFVHQPAARIYPIQAVLLAVIGFYFNISLGFTSVIFVLVVLIYAFSRKKIGKKPFAGYLLLLAGLIFGGAVLLRVDLRGYLSGSWHLLHSYGDAMFLPAKAVEREELNVALMVLAGFFLLVLWQALESRLKKQAGVGGTEPVLYFLTGSSMFLYFKEGFVRSSGHTHIFFQIAVCIAGLLYLFGPGGKWNRIFAVYCWLVLLLSSFGFNLDRWGSVRYSRLIDLSYISSRIDEIGTYFKELKVYNGTMRAEQDQFSGSNDLKNIIGSHTVDIIPWDISTIGLNGLHYDPRPAMQSHYAYDTYLDSLGREKYLSVDAPEYVLFQNMSIDGNFPFFDEGRTKLALLDRYIADREVGNYLLLRKSKGSPRLIPLGKQVTEVRLNEDIPIRKTNNIQFSHFYLRYGDPAAIRRFLFQPLPIEIVLTLENGEVFNYRITKPVLEDGVLINKYTDSKEEFQVLMQGSGRLNANIKKVRLVADTSLLGFVSSIQMVSEFYRFRPKEREEARADSMGLVQLLGPKKPILLDPALLSTDSIRYGFAGVNTMSRLAKVNGWAFLEKEDNNDRIVTVIARSPSGTYEFPSEDIPDPSFGSALGRQDIKNARVASAVDKAQLPPGDYQLGFAVRHANSSRRSIRLTGLLMLNPSNYKVEEIGEAEKLPAIAKDITSYTDVQTEYGRVHIEGWAFLKGEESARSVTNIILKGSGVSYRISTDKTLRQDVADHYGDPALSYCGYVMDIPDTAVLRGVYTVWLEQICCDGKRSSLKFTDHELRIGYADQFAPIPIAGNIPVQSFQTAINHYEDDPDSLKISGWAIRDMATVQSSMIDIILKDDKFDLSIYSSPTNPDPRKDVTLFFHNGFNLDNSGFSAKILKDDLPPGRYRIGIQVHRKGELGSVKFLDLYSVRK